ncbi:MAG: hypothetical protein IJD14_07115, partial [Christensenellaceae bacterium]|nr:hypothetical protein [Christensenellaceae bacterium]
MKKYTAVTKNIILILFSAILFLCTACTPIDPVISEPTLEIPKEEPYLSTVLEITENSSSEYSIICSREDASLTAAIMLHEAVLNATGASLPVLIDETSEKISQKEIIVGNTVRPESGTVLTGEEENNFTVKADGEKIIINAKTSEALIHAVKVFLNEHLSYDPELDTYLKNELLIEKNYEFTGEYHFTVDARDAEPVSVPEKYPLGKYTFSDGIYISTYPETEFTGAATTFQTNSHYRPTVHINSDSVMIYSPHEEIINTWTDMEYTYGIEMMIAINRADNGWALEHPGSVQTTKKGMLMQHSAKATYYMVPTEEFTEYLWSQVEKALLTFRPSVIVFEEPEMWNESGYSNGFKAEWQNYFGEEWQDPASSPEALYKSMELKTYLFTRIEDVLYERIKYLSPETKMYIATHSTPNYNSWDITAGLGHYTSSDNIDGIIAQTWSDTVRTPFPYNGKKTVDEFVNAYIDYSSYTHAAEGLAFYALSDPMSDNPVFKESANRQTYLNTVTASLLRPEIQRFELCPWVHRAYENVSPSYRTVLQQTFNALNEVGGKETVLETGTVGISYVMSDTMSWLKNTAWAPDTEKSFYGITAPLVNAGIPLNIKNLENINSADDLSDTKLLLLSYDSMLPMNDTANKVIAEWVKGGGTLLVLSGDNKFWDIEDVYQNTDGIKGSPASDLFDKLGTDIKINTSLDGKKALQLKNSIGINTKKIKLGGRNRNFANSFEGAEHIFTLGKHTLGIHAEAGEGNVIAIGIPSEYYSTLVGSALLKELVKYSLTYTDLNYAEKNLLKAKRGNIVAAHTLKKSETLLGTYIDIASEDLNLLTDPTVAANKSQLLYDISAIDLSIP